MSKRSITIDKASLAILKDLDDKKLLGSAFVFIRPNWLLTAKHVVLYEGLPRGNISAVFGNVEISAKVIYCHKEVDLAVLELAENICRFPMASGHASLAGRQGLFCVGYSPTMTQHHGRPLLYANDVPTFEYEKRERNFGVEELITFEAPYAEGGHSGGPILGDGGNVVGVVIQSFSKNNKLHLRATSVSPLLNELILPYP
jgi:S1-C subfamily serine protease